MRLGALVARAAVARDSCPLVSVRMASAGGGIAGANLRAGLAVSFPDPLLDVLGMAFGDGALINDGGGDGGGFHDEVATTGAVARTRSGVP